MQTLTTVYNVQNGVKLPFDPSKILKGPNNGDPTLRPNFKSIVNEDGAEPALTPELKNLIKYVGINESFGILVQKLNTLAINCFNQAKVTDNEGKETGEIDLNLWQQLIAGATIAGETIGDLEDKLDELSQQFEALTMDENNTDLSVVMPQLRAISEEKKKIKETLAKRQEDAKVVAAKRAATKEANEAKQRAALAAAGGSPVSA